MPPEAAESEIGFMIKWIWHLLQKTEKACATSHTDIDGNCLRCRSLEAARGMLMERPDNSDMERIASLDETIAEMILLMDTVDEVIEEDA